MKPWLIKGAVVLGSTIFGLLFAEIAVVLFLTPPQAFTVSRGSSDGEYEAKDLESESQVEFTGMYIKTETGRRLRPNTTLRITNHRTSGLSTILETNSLGLRGKEPKNKSRTRVLFIGDSITLAEYLPEEQTFVRLVGALSEKTDEPLETINAGIGGVSLANEYALLLETGLSLNPDVVVLDFYLNDVHESPGVRPIKVPGILKKSVLAQHLFAHLSRVRGLEQEELGGQETRERWESWFLTARRQYPMAEGDPNHSYEAFNKEILTYFGNWGNVWIQEVWDFMYPLFQEFSRLSIVHDFRLLIVCFPVIHQLTSKELRDFPQRRLSLICESLNIPFLDLLPLLREAAALREESLFFDDCHPNSDANQMIAEWLLPFIHKHR